MKKAILAMLVITLLLTGCNCLKCVETQTNNSGVKGVECVNATFTMSGATIITMNDGGVIKLPSSRTVLDVCNDGVMEYTRYESRFMGFLPNPDVHKIRCRRPAQRLGINP